MKFFILLLLFVHARKRRQRTRGLSEGFKDYKEKQDDNLYKCLNFYFFSRQNSKKCPNGFIDIDSGKNEEETGNCIFIIPPLDFKASRKICEYLGGHLARPVLGSKC